MRDYALHQAQVSGNLPGVGNLGTLIRNWSARRAVRRLADLDDHLLRDMGTTREDIVWAGRQPLTVNASLVLEQRQRQRTFQRHVF